MKHKPNYTRYEKSTLVSKSNHSRPASLNLVPLFPNPHDTATNECRSQHSSSERTSSIHPPSIHNPSIRRERKEKYSEKSLIYLKERKKVKNERERKGAT
jgi:hypothetical protein